MSPKDDFQSPVEINDEKDAAVTSQKLQSSHLTALAIALVAVVWMMSGLIGGDDVAVAPAGGEVQAEKAVETPRVRVAKVIAEDHVRTIAVLGRTEAENAVSVRAENTGRVAEVVATKGAMVEAGDILLKLDPENLPALLAEANARLAQHKIAYESARKLSQGGYSSQLKLAQSKADLEAARAQVSGMRRDLNNATITAPFAGVVDELPLDAGDYVDKVGTVVARVIDLNTMLAVGEVVERDIGSISLGGRAMVELTDGRSFDAKVSFISKASSAQTRTFRVEVQFQVPDGSVPEGMTAQLRLPTEQVRAHNISPALLTLDDEGSVGVKSVNHNGVVEFHAVEMVTDTKDGIWLVGLPQEALIISVGQEFVSIGQKVIPVEGALTTARPNDQNASTKDN